MEKESQSREMDEKRSADFLFGKMEARLPGMKEKQDMDGHGNLLMPPLFMELAHRIKNTLSSIRNITRLSKGKFKDVDFEEYFSRAVSDDIEKIETVIDGLLNYVKVSTPILKSNTVNSIVEEIVEKHRDQIEEKKIRLIKKLEKGLSETVVHEEQLRYVFNSIFQYALLTTPPNGSVALVTRMFDRQDTPSDKKGGFQRDGRYVEVLVVFSGFKKPLVTFETAFQSAALQKDEAMDLILRLVKEIVQKNRGMMRFDIDEKKPQTFITLLFPIERRKIVSYPRANP